MARFKSPDGTKHVTVRANTPEFWTYYRAGWIDVTKPSSNKQIVQRKRWRELGELGSAIQTLRRLKANSLVSRLSNSCIDTTIASLLLDDKTDKESRNG